MEILFKSAKLKKQCCDLTLLQRSYGQACAKKIRARLDDLAAAPNLETMRKLPGRCHELKGRRAGQFALDLEGPRRLIFVPGDDLVPEKPEGGIDWSGVSCIKILGIEDYHG